jgi:hypothetical protein
MSAPKATLRPGAEKIRYEKPKRKREDKMVKKLALGLLLISLFFQSGCGQEEPAVTGVSHFETQGVTITDQGNYFKVTLDFKSGLSHRQIGEALGTGILRAVPNYEALVDAYIAETLTNYEYPDAFFRVDDLKLRLNQDYKDEIEGMASKFSGGTHNVRQDKKLSRDELYIFNLFPDIIRNTQCCFVSVFGARSATHKTLAARNLDWFGGSLNQLPKIQAIITLEYPQKKLCSLGYLGYMGIITGFNDSKVFGAIIDSQSGEAYSSQGRRSYPLDLRFALENKTSLGEVAGFILDPEKCYAVNYVIALSDPVESKVLENNFSGTGTTRQRVKPALRTAGSRLNPGITWGISNAIGSVNSFLLYGNYDNHTPNKYNTKRWKNMKEQLLSKGPEVSMDELREVVSFDHGWPGTFMDSGDLYNRSTLQSIIFEPDTFSLEVFFHPRNTRKSPRDPEFEKIVVFQP